VNNRYLFSYIIGYRHSSERLNNLRRVLDWLKGFQGIEIIIVEQDVSSKLTSFTLPGIKYVFTKSDMPYNRSWAFNVGLKHSCSNVVVFGDSDLVMDPMELIESLKLIEQYDCISPYKAVLDLTQQESQMQIQDFKNIARPGRGETDNQKINLCGGIVIYKKEAIVKIGGWCEDFIGWGGEDNFQEHKTKTYLTHFESPYRCYHFWHHRGAPDNKWYARTMDLLNKLVNLNRNDLEKQIQASLPKIGLLNKYA
jgi:glycosyltransferase involved in cell wall biosynthesis